jgi:methyl-accepting chemotaxis protein
MTGEEMERAIEFLLKNQAGFDVKLDRLTEEVTEMSKQVRLHAETQTEFIKVVTRHTEDQARINEEQRRTNAEFRATQTRLAEGLLSLATTVQRFIGERDSSSEQT